MTAVIERPASRPVSGIGALLASATSEVLVMRTSAAARTQCPIGAISQIDLENVRRGVRYRMLVPDNARTAPRLAGQLVSFAQAGASIRSVPAVPMDALIIDGTVAMMPTGPTGVTPIRLPSVITTTTELFKRVWADAVALDPYDVPDPRPLSDKHLKLLSLLYSGNTDEAAAARMELSVRTVRRMVSEMNDLLGARSRFQAGAKAAQRGWITDGTDR
ncbi:helix-turn-helix transcriptional regulator [Fodinicola acaciae]|uniref:helix-turn-helix transcriptional regulator n=1 Tax=Fodinicola acaciae TaxID=2681555 RepID=UPI0013D5A3B3|nr:helix-turn-helix transcriptional regulator [Fodinicola acaciae]